MINIDDLDKAEDNIDKLFRLRDELNNGTPNLNDMKSKIMYYKKLCSEIPIQSSNILSLIEPPILSVLSLSPTNLNYSSLSGATGSFYAVSADTRDIIKSYGNKYYHLVTEYDELNNTQDLIDRIAEIIITYRSELLEFNPNVVLLEAKDAYAKWEAGSLDNSDLALKIRAFHDIFNGLLKRAWVHHSYKPVPKKYPKFSWPKIANSLGKSSGSKKDLLKLQGADIRLHLSFTEIMKKTKLVENAKMESDFKEYIEHVYAIVNLIDQDLMK